MRTSEPISVLVIDDSAVNRRAITQILESAPDVKVIERASDGEEGLKKAALLRPEVITLDLEMPRLDGFAFLRLLMAHAPTPVIVISSYSHGTDVFKALELGALDFIAKPPKGEDGPLSGLKEELLGKVRLVRQLGARPGPLEAPARGAAAEKTPGPMRILAVGASTGGPPAVQTLLQALAGEPVCVLVAQHMPSPFTCAFAERLDRLGPLRVSEAKDGDPIRPGHVYVCPGGRNLLLAGQPERRLWLRVEPPNPAERHSPSVDRLFESVAACLGAEARGVVLTGMGDDGARGALAMHRAGGEVWAESEKSAVIFGMPQEAIAAGGVRHVLPLPELGPALVRGLRQRPHR